MEIERFGRGASYQDVLTIMENYGAYNATCLDGGASTGMTIQNQLINNPTTKSGSYRSRPVPTAFLLKSDEKDDGDFTIVANKLK